MERKGRARLDTPLHQAGPPAFAIAERNARIIAMLRDAIGSRCLRLAYQPVVLATDTARIGFYEGLMRVLDASGRTIPARDFMPAVEGHDIEREIDCAALRMGLATLSHQPRIRLSINMSALSIGHPKWMKILHQGLKAHPGLAERLILEITESSAVLAHETLATFMRGLQAEGIAFAVDDFGAGYTTLKYFKDFSFDILKIDGQFIRDIHRDRDNQVLTSAMLGIGKQFDMLCVAESVETTDEARFLQTLGFDCLQGYLFGAPTLDPIWAPSPRRQSA